MITNECRINIQYGTIITQQEKSLIEHQEKFLFGNYIQGYCSFSHAYDTYTYIFQIEFLTELILETFLVCPYLLKNNLAK